ncbi:probable phosphoglycerate mutase [Pseudobutyrivibrio sp. YE44]|uniref:histidine phosphatase family protein n=1 Tax=Pseudobutyrivibrio sp. YE44 TaxID=1520802 RepID=UPI00088B3E25|nr:histidine phosphatase family protein [Pseudobutyrivibrio sp. YE44]SDB24885.1 probable phosphoglycerate mutase [Pseudobutyrivibrio sp. YE44]
MRFLFIRHGDPDYENDTLTEKGHREAKLLADIIESYGIDEIYQSPLGRAKDTAAYSCKKLGIEPVTLDWLQEFPAQADPNVSEAVKTAYGNEITIDETTGKYKTHILWDVLPSYYMNHPELFDREGWRESEIVKASDMSEIYDQVIGEFDKFIADNGYVKEGMAYKVTENNDKTIAFYCHYGLTSLLLSRLWNVSPFVAWQFTALAPTSVTEVVTEEREKGIATFRTLRAGEITHLKMGKEEPSFSARFCERFENEDERH